MKCKECYYVTEINGEYVADCELPGGKCPLENNEGEDNNDEES